MRHPRLVLLTFIFFTGLVFLFSWQFIQPIEPPENTQEQIIPGSIDKPIVTFVNPTIGPVDAKVTIIEYGDFQCDACRQMNDSISAVLRAYPEEVRFVWKHIPNETLHPVSFPAAIASACAQDQGAFWPYYEELFDRQAFLSEEQLFEIARDVKLNEQSFENCYRSNETAPLIQKDINEAIGLNLISSPTVFINDTRHVGALSTEQLIQYVEAEL